MIGFAGSFIGGIAAFNFFPFFPFSIITLSIATTIFLFLIPPNPPLVKGGRGDFWTKKFLIILIFAFGFLYIFIRHENFPEIQLPDREVFVEGTIIDVPEISREKIRFTLDYVYIEKKKIQGKIRLFVLLKRFFNNKAHEYSMPAPGDRISAITKIREPNVFHNPGIYSYDLKKDGIIAVGYIRQMKVIGRGGGLLAWLGKKRQVLGRIIDNSLLEENASLHKAIIPGLKRGISQDMRDSFSSTGLAHLLSISGTHFGLLAFIIFKIVRMIIKFLPVKILTRMTLYITPTQIAIVLTLPVLVFYALISGTSTPTVRSFIMVFIYMLALFLGRKGQWLNSLSIAAIIILLWQPDALFELSFQLSFLAVLSIGYVLEKRSEHPVPDTALYRTVQGGTGQSTELKSPHPPFTKGGMGGIKRIFERVKTAILITVAAVLGTAPLVAVYFKQFPLISPVTNLIVTPLVCFIILPLGFFTGFGALLFNMSSMPLSGLTDAITHFALDLVNIFSNIPYSNLHVSNPSFAIMVLYFFSLMFIIRSKPRTPAAFLRKQEAGVWGKFKWRFLPLVLVISFYLVSPYLSNDNLRITFLDVGEGDASIVELSDKKVMLIDGGPYNLDTGRRVIAPYLWSKGIRQIDFMVLSHPHPDHYGGLIYIIDNFKVGEIWLNGRSKRLSAKTRFGMIPEAGEFFQKIQEEKIPSKILRRGDVLEARDYKIYVLHPYDEFYADSPRGEFSNENSDSLVLKMDTGDISFLLTGDVEIEAEENLMYLGKWLRSDIIKVPHHGGRTSSSEEFLKMVKPQTAVVSAGKDNPFNHPHRETLERYKDVGVKFFRTDKNGAVTITSRDNSYEIKTYWDSRLKEVQGLRDEIRNLRLLL